MSGANALHQSWFTLGMPTGRVLTPYSVLSIRLGSLDYLTDVRGSSFACAYDVNLTAIT